MQEDQEILTKLLHNASPQSLWCVDDNIHNIHQINFQGTAITNRYDIAIALHETGIDTHFNNFNFSNLDISFNQAFFRIAKEKAINLHIISSILKRLPIKGKLFLIGRKNEGIKSLIKKIQDNYSCEINIEKYKNQLQLITISPSVIEDIELLNPPYHIPQWIEKDTINFYSQYGVFGWNKIDKGSQLLVVALKKIILGPDKTQITRLNILDLGCGYGYLSLEAHRLGFNNIDATDNNAAAIEACQKNFENAEIAGIVYADDCGRSTDKKYDIILSNPPFHKGFDHHKDLSEDFMNAIAHKLKDGGNAYIVCNQFIGVEKLAGHLFQNITLLEHTDGFKVFALKR